MRHFKRHVENFTVMFFIEFNIKIEVNGSSPRTQRINVPEEGDSTNNVLLLQSCQVRHEVPVEVLFQYLDSVYFDKPETQ